MKILMGNFQVYDAMNKLFKLQEPPVKHFEGFILLPKKVASCKKYLKLLIGNSSSRTRKNSPTRSTKVGASMVGKMFVVATMSY